MDTIYALASAHGKAGVAVIRVSGPSAVATVKALTGTPITCPGRSLRWLLDRSGAKIDEALILSFAAGRSFTGEETVEYQTHGSLAVISAVLEELSAIEGVRPAEPGEFTRRALENNRLDLAQVEGLADLIDAETEAQRRQAQRIFSGALAELVGKWRSGLIRAMALIEATIDFADEEVPEDVVPEVRALIDALDTEISEEVRKGKIAERIRDGFEVAIVGRPNVGKSTLLNRLAGREAALTSSVAGTTRDVVEVRMDLRGLPVTFLDTAGMRATQDPIEAMGVALAQRRGRAADLRIVLVLAEARDIPEELVLEPDDIVVLGQADRGGIAGTEFAVSGTTGEGIERLMDTVHARLEDRAGSSGVAVRERHRLGMKGALAALCQAREALPTAAERAEVVAFHLNAAVRCLDSVIGRVDVEDVLDEIFASFCLGK